MTAKSKQTLYHYNQQIQKQLIEAIQPLTDNFGLKTFSYLRFYKDGRYLNLCNDSPWQKFSLQQTSDSKSFAEEVKNLPYATLHQVHWPQNLQDPFLQALHSHEIWNGLTFYYASDEYIEGWAFSGSPRDHTIVNHIANNPAFYKKFITYFNKAHKHLYEGYDLQKLPVLEVLYEPLDHIETDIPLIEKKLEATWDKALGKPILSSREYQCLHYIKQGCSAKEIARFLAISPRTVEHYVSNMLKKFRCTKVIELLIRVDC